MKRTVSLILILATLFSLCACGNGGNTDTEIDYISPYSAIGSADVILRGTLKGRSVNIFSTEKYGKYKFTVSEVLKGDIGSDNTEKALSVIAYTERSGEGKYSKNYKVGYEYIVCLSRSENSEYFQMKSPQSMVLCLDDYDKIYYGERSGIFVLNTNGAEFGEDITKDELVRMIREYAVDADYSHAQGLRYRVRGWDAIIRGELVDIRTDEARKDQKYLTFSVSEIVAGDIELPERIEAPMSTAILELVNASFEQIYELGNEYVVFLRAPKKSEDSIVKFELMSSNMAFCLSDYERSFLWNDSPMGNRAFIGTEIFREHPELDPDMSAEEFIAKIKEWATWSPYLDN